MLRYEISNSNRSAIDTKMINKCVRFFALAAKIKKPQSFSLAFVDGRTIRKFNRAYRGRDKTTDVLSFAERDSEFVGPGEAEDLGEVLICLSQAKSQARVNGWPVDYEICRLLVHGLAHLVGYEHEGVSRQEERRMIDFEKKALAGFGSNQID